MKETSETNGYILVVDDEETMCQTLADILRLDGYRVLPVTSGEAAIQALKREVFDLILLDLKMPGIDGLEVLSVASKISPDTLVIFLTAHGSLESAIEAMRHEAYDYLLKPSTPAQILKSVAGALVKRQEQLRRRQLLDKLDNSIKQLVGAERRDSSPVLEMTMIPVVESVYFNLSRREIWQAHPDDEQEVRVVPLTPAEGKLLKVLLDHRGQVFTHRELVARVQGYTVADWEAPEVLRPLVSRLRQKLALFSGGDHWITNVRGTGYVFEAGLRRENSH